MHEISLIYQQYVRQNTYLDIEAHGEKAVDNGGDFDKSSTLGS